MHCHPMHVHCVFYAPYALSPYACALYILCTQCIVTLYICTVHPMDHTHCVPVALCTMHCAPYTPMHCAVCSKVWNLPIILDFWMSPMLLMKVIPVILISYHPMTMYPSKIFTKALNFLQIEIMEYQSSMPCHRFLISWKFCSPLEILCTHRRGQNI